MEFCDECGTLRSPGNDAGECNECGAPVERPGDEVAHSDGGSSSSATSTELEGLPTTSSGSVKKADAMDWLENRDRPMEDKLRRAILEKPSVFTGSKYPSDISTIRLTGDPRFIETVAGLFSWIVRMEDFSRRVEINLKETEDKETGEKTENYALYLSLAERG